MATIIDKSTSKPKVVNATICWVWEVITYEYDDYAETEVEKIEAVFYDPWKAAEYALKRFGITSGVRAAMYHIDNCN